MESALTIIPSFSSRSFFPSKSSQHCYGFAVHFPNKKLNMVKASFNTNSTPNRPNPFAIFNLKSTTAAIIFAAAAATAAHLPARAQPPPPPPPPILTEQQNLETHEANSPLTQFLESNSEAVEALRTLLQQKLEVGEDEEGLKILKKLSAAQPENAQWKFLMARLYNEMGKAQEARGLFEEILTKNPLSFEALFENALLMDRCGEGEAVMRRLEDALRFAEAENKLKEARDVRLIVAQMHFLHKNLDEALRIYEELLAEDPKDFRPYFCKGMIYSLLDKNKEAREQFAKYRKLSPKKFEVQGYLRTPLSRMDLFATDDHN